MKGFPGLPCLLFESVSGFRLEIVLSFSYPFYVGNITLSLGTSSILMIMLFLVAQLISIE